MSTLVLLTSEKMHEGKEGPKKGIPVSEEGPEICATSARQQMMNSKNRVRLSSVEEAQVSSAQAHQYHTLDRSYREFDA